MSPTLDLGLFLILTVVKDGRNYQVQTDGGRRDVPDCCQEGGGAHHQGGGHDDRRDDYAHCDAIGDLVHAGEELFGLRQFQAEREPSRGGQVDDLPRAMGKVEHELIQIEQGRIKVPGIEFLPELLASDPTYPGEPFRR